MTQTVHGRDALVEQPAREGGRLLRVGVIVWEEVPECGVGYERGHDGAHHAVPVGGGGA